MKVERILWLLKRILPFIILNIMVYK